MNNKKYGAFSSSVDPQKLAMTVKGILVGVLPVIILVVKQFTQIDISVEAGQLTDLISDLIMGVGGVASILMTGYGLVRKIYNKVIG